MGCGHVAFKMYKNTAASINRIFFLTFRYQGVSLEMLLKLVRVFGSVIYSSLSASSSVGVDIEAEQRCDSDSSQTSPFHFLVCLF